MVLSIFNFFKGYLIIKVSGFSVERFINLAMNRNIYLSDIKYKNSYVTMKVSIDGFRLLKPIAKKTKCKIVILNKSGLPFLIFRYRKRKILALGICFFVLSIYLLSSRIWLLELNGLERIDYNTLENFLKNKGLYTSAEKSKVDIENIEEELIKSFGDIAWVNIDINGTKAIVSIKETIVKEKENEQMKSSSSNPTNIVAKKDGIIDTIVASTGTVKVKPLDVVKKGDVLIEGILTVKEDEFGVLKKYVTSEGEVLAKTYYNFEYFVPFEYETKIYTGKETVDNRFKFFNKNYELLKPNVSFDNYSRASTYNELSLGEDYPLPFIFIKDTYKEFQTQINRRTILETEELAYKIADSKILHELAFSINIVDKRVELSENKDGVSVSISIDAIEDISESVEIDEQNDNTTNQLETENN